MAAIENLEIIVDVDIGSALAALEDLQDELRDLAESIEAVDAVGTEGIDIRTNLDDADAELAALQAKLEAFEAANELNIDTDFDRGRYTIPNFQQGGTKADNIGELFSFLDLPGGGRDRGRGGILGSLRKQAGELSDTFDDFDLRMSDMHNMMARLVPLLLVFIGVIPAAVTALVGLAAAAIAAAASLAAIVGFGAMGVGLQDGQFDMQRLTDVFEDIRDSFIEAFAPLAERLEPLFLDAIDGLERFFQAVAGQSDALMALTDEARAFGGFLMDFVPGALRALAGHVEALSPLFKEFGQWLGANFNNIVHDLASLTTQAAPAIAELIIKLGQAVPWLVEMSIGFTMVANVVVEVLGLLNMLMNLLGINARVFGIVTASVLALASAIALTNLFMQSFIGTALVGAITSMYRFAIATATASSTMTFFGSTTIASAIGALVSFIASLITSGAALLGFSVSAYTATAAAAAFLTVVTLGAGAAIIGVALSASSAFLGLAGNIDSATKSLKDFDRVSGKTDGFNPYGRGTEGAGAAAVGGSGQTRGEGAGTTINIESSGDPDEDRSNGRYAGWRQGRTTGGTN
jgi:hypothetical protein